MCGISLPSRILFRSDSIDDGYFEGFAPNRAYVSLHLSILGSSPIDFCSYSRCLWTLTPRRSDSIAEMRRPLSMFFAVITPIFRFWNSSNIFGSIMNFIRVWPVVGPVDIFGHNYTHLVEIF